VNDLLLGNAAGGVPRMSGEAAHVIAEAQARRTQALSEAESKARLFEAEVVAYEAADQVYKVRKYLEMLKESLDKMRKFVLTADASEMNLIVVFETEKKSVIDIAEETE
jgi:regulator of protease activity HflC (stomatin/prohibitin superfamily)